MMQRLEANMLLCGIDPGNIDALLLDLSVPEGGEGDEGPLVYDLLQDGARRGGVNTSFSSGNCQVHYFVEWISREEVRFTLVIQQKAGDHGPAPCLDHLVTLRYTAGGALPPPQVTADGRRVEWTVIVPAHRLDFGAGLSIDPCTRPEYQVA